jgi:hypothetical protein
MLPGIPKHVECATILSLVVVKAGGWRLEAGSWRLEAGSWRLEAGVCMCAGLVHS